MVSLQLEKPRGVPRVALRCDLALVQDRAALASWDGLGLGWNKDRQKRLGEKGRGRASVPGAHSSLKCRD